MTSLAAAGSDQQHADQGMHAYLAYRSITCVAEGNVCALASRPSVSIHRGPVEEHQMEVADLDLVAVGWHRRAHRLTVDIGAVETAGVDDPDFAVCPSDLGVPAADGDVVKVDVAVGMPASGCDGLIQREPRSGVGSALYDKRIPTTAVLPGRCPIRRRGIDTRVMCYRGLSAP
jgi:hypothetical protein